jgi:hypothetical protein
MAKTRQSTETAKALVSPLFAWTNAFLKSGEMMLDSVGAATRNANTVRVAVLRDVETPLRQTPLRPTLQRKRSARTKSNGRSTRSKANGRSRSAKGRRRR